MRTASTATKLALIALALAACAQPDAPIPTAKCNALGGVSAQNAGWAWGSNVHGQLGDGTTIERHSPVQVQNLSGFQTIAAGGRHGLGLTRDCTVWAWGSNDLGQLGDGTTNDRSMPGQVPR